MVPLDPRVFKVIRVPQVLRVQPELMEQMVRTVPRELPVQQEPMVLPEPMVLTVLPVQLEPMELKGR